MSVPAGYAVLLSAKRLLRSLNLDAASEQQFFELPEREHVVLVGRNDERERRLPHAASMARRPMS